MRRVTRIFSIALTVAVLVLVCLAAVLVFGKMDKTVAGFGMVTPGRRVGVTPMIGGIVRKVLVGEGQSVEENDTLLVIHSEEVELEVKRTKSALADALSDLEMTEEEYNNLTTSKSYELGVILADLNEAEQRMKFDEENLARTKALYDKGLVNQQEYDKQRLTFESSKSYYRVLKARSEIVIARTDRERGEKRRDVALARSSVELAETRLGYTSVVAPIGGIVLTSEPENLVGTAVGRGEPVMEIGCFDDLVFSAQVGENDITGVQIGQPARMFMNSYPHREYKVFKGEVSRIASVPTISEGQSTFEVRVRIAEPWVEEENGSKTPLRYGLRGRVEIIVEPSVRLYRLLMGDLDNHGS